MLLRLAEPDDTMAVARVHVRSWQVGYRTLLPGDFLDRLRPEDRAERYDFATRDPGKACTIVALQDGDILGFATVSPARDADLPDHGELCAFYVDPPWWGRGVGRALISAARAHLVEQGFRHAMLWVIAGNVRAERFYRVDRWAPDGFRRAVARQGLTLDEIRYRRDLAE
ncbi:MAG TPA: GNAT family N-acetyltransferase [Bryobacteraceae bacterium]|jgi:GNAT superfamily N-acetyltransferase|nr:GNAT family N-acetyltransferase [Bryobacteraceae bacterium]